MMGSRSGGGIRPIPMRRHTYPSPQHTRCARGIALFFAATLPAAWPATALPRDWRPIDAAVESQMTAGMVPGAVLITGDARDIWLRRAWGWRVAEQEPMTLDTVFDLASLTKVVCTTTAVLQLVERQRIRLASPAARYWPAFAANGKSAITVGQLLSHSSGLRPGLSLAEGDGLDDVWRKVAHEAALHEPGSQRVYSDINFEVLGRVVEKVSRVPLDRYCARRVFAPLRMRDSGFKPITPARLARIAPTTSGDAGQTRGQVHDPTALRLGGIAGNAGLFGTADDLARFAQALLKGGVQGVLPRRQVRDLQRPHSPVSEEGWQGWGWKLEAPLVAERQGLPPVGAIGHTGYTGTGIWIDFVQQRFVVLLTSRLPSPGGDARPLRRQVLALLSSLSGPLTSPTRGDLASAALGRLLPFAPPEAPRKVRTGIDVLVQERYASLRGRRVALLTHQAALDGAGWRTLDRLRWADGVKLVKILTPEHGLYAKAEGPVEDGHEPFSGLPVFSLYGGIQAPTRAMLQDVDTLVVDLQDVGVRYYTYIATMGMAMEAAAHEGVRVIVLDRPNPIRADRVAGPMLDDGLQGTLTGYAALPVQHGMTMGEMARFLQNNWRQRGGPPLDLAVVPMVGYQRSMWFDQTGLDWLPPSPNMRKVRTAILYPGVAWVEGANVSVGRGTEAPFERVGAPWISGESLAGALKALALPGVAFSPTSFTPTHAIFEGQRCEGVDIKIVDRDVLDAPLLGAALVKTLFDLWPRAFQIEKTRMLMGSDETLDQIKQGRGLAEIQAQWQGSREAFERLRREALIYGP
jgi:uncharacterized protein YbbC (DUF1343 family)/CubicO group peptidase (beta-lactamase class C family)